MKRWKYAISSADIAPKTSPILLLGDVCENLRKASDLGYDAIEIHTRETAFSDYDEILKEMSAYNVEISMIVTGRLNTEAEVNLIDDRPYITDSAIKGMKKYVDIAKRLNASGIIVGWVRGNIPNIIYKKRYIDRLAQNIREICEYAGEQGIKVNIEVINRYEINTFNTAQETLAFISEYNIPNCYIHLDTFHMNIDEASPIKAILDCGDKLGYIHIADNTRDYPGSGQIDFFSIFEALKKIDYNGYISVECLPKPDALTAARKAIRYLSGYVLNAKTYKHL